MVVAWQLDYLVKTNVVELARFLPMDRVDCHDKLTVVMSPAILLAFPLSIVVLSLIYGLSLSLTLVFAEDCTDRCYTVNQVMSIILCVNACNKVCKSILVTQNDRQKWETKVDLIVMLYHLGFKTNFYRTKII